MNVDIDQEKQVATCTSPKRKDPFYIVRDGKYHYFKVAVERGKVPSFLMGRFSSLESGVKAVEQWEREASETKAAHRDAFLEARKAQKEKAKDAKEE